MIAVRRLVDAQFPEWRGLPINRFASQGTVNALFRRPSGITSRATRR